MPKSLHLFLTFLVLSVIFLTTTRPVSAATLTVCATGTVGQDGCQYIGGDSIQAAVDAAQDGDTILLRSGTYTRTNFTQFAHPENGTPRKAFILIPNSTRTFTIQGETGAILNGAGSTHALSGIILLGGTTNITNLTISGMKNDPDSCFSGAGPCGNGIGIWLSNSAQATISGNTIQGNQNSGLYLTNSAQASISNNTIQGNQDDGVSLSKSAQATISGNSIQGNQDSGLNLTNSAQASISANTIQGNQEDGVYLNESTQATITNNTLYNNRITGINLYSYSSQDNSHAPHATIINNVITQTQKNTDNTFGFAIGGGFLHTNPHYDTQAEIDQLIHHNLEFSNAGAGSGCGNNELCTYPNRILADPLYQDAVNDNLYLPHNSPGRYSGDPAILNPDGTRSTMGYQGGPGSASMYNGLIFNGSFETNSTSAWTISPSTSLNIINGIAHPPTPHGDYYARVARTTSGDAYIASDWIETGQNVTGKSFTLNFQAKSHEAPKTISAIGVQRFPNGNDWSNTISWYNSVDLTTQWQEFNRTITFAEPTNGNQSTKIRVVLRTPDEGDLWPIYYDNISLILTTALPTHTPTPLASLTPTSDPSLTPSPTLDQSPTQAPVSFPDYNNDYRINIFDFNHVIANNIFSHYTPLLTLLNKPRPNQ